MSGCQRRLGAMRPTWASSWSNTVFGDRRSTTTTGLSAWEAWTARALCMKQVLTSRKSSSRLAVIVCRIDPFRLRRLQSTTPRICRPSSPLNAWRTARRKRRRAGGSAESAGGSGCCSGCGASGAAELEAGSTRRTGEARELRPPASQRSLTSCTSLASTSGVQSTMPATASSSASRFLRSFWSCVGTGYSGRTTNRNPQLDAFFPTKV
mmetsp:Transcript_48028/g.113358  ORF Transcript_48028/g.113358 Transcript_48028/m.113358 type:complete len:209 (-) Transcript_48028:413-1039(-)